VKTTYLWRISSLRLSHVLLVRSFACALNCLQLRRFKRRNRLRLALFYRFWTGVRGVLNFIVAVQSRTTCTLLRLRLELLAAPPF